MTEQGSLFTPPPRARNTDPHTSHEAAESVQRQRESQEAVRRLLGYIGPSTDEDLRLAYEEWQAKAKLPKQSPSGLRTRRSELVAMGIVRDSGARQRLDSGRQAIVWEVVPRG